MIRVLIVDDSATARLLLTKLLTSDPDIEVVGTANDGAEAVARALELRPNLITMDIRMPRMDGLEATRRIMEQIPTPIIVVSADTDPATPGRIAELGVDAFFAKPFSPAQVRRKLEQLLDARTQ